MNSVITFCIFSVMLMQAATFDPLAGITRLKNTVNSVINDLTRFKINLRFNLNLRLSNLKIDQMSNVNIAVNPVISGIRNAITAVENEGRAAEHCYEPARQQLNDASKTAFSALDTCVKDQLDTLKPLEQNIESHLNVGNSLLSNLDGIAKSCSSSNFLQTQQCVAEAMPEASQKVQNFQDVANLLKNTGDVLSSSGVINVNHCFQTPMSNLRESVSAVQISATNCINAST